MRLRKKPWAKPEVEGDSKAILTPAVWKGKWQEAFGNDYTLHVEFGCGRGQFISEKAERNPRINYIGIDIHHELLVYVLRKANERGLNNIRIIPMYLEKIAEVFAQGEVERIYINFCNPWPNKRHHKRRLTHPNFLRIYKTFLKDGAEIWLKTDDDRLFDDSRAYFQAEGFTESYLTLDLHQSNFDENIMTEYEEKFCGQGIKIKLARFRKGSD